MFYIIFFTKDSEYVLMNNDCVEVTSVENHRSYAIEDWADYFQNHNEKVNVKGMYDNAIYDGFLVHVCCEEDAGNFVLKQIRRTVFEKNSSINTVLSVFPKVSIPRRRTTLPVLSSILTSCDENSPPKQSSLYLMAASSNVSFEGPVTPTPAKLKSQPPMPAVTPISQNKAQKFCFNTPPPTSCSPSVSINTDINKLIKMIADIKVTVSEQGKEIATLKEKVKSLEKQNVETPWPDLCVKITTVDDIADIATKCTNSSVRQAIVRCFFSRLFLILNFYFIRSIGLHLKEVRLSKTVWHEWQRNGGIMTFKFK